MVKLSRVWISNGPAIQILNGCMVRIPNTAMFGFRMFPDFRRSVIGSALYLCTTTHCTMPHKMLLQWGSELWTSPVIETGHV